MEDQTLAGLRRLPGVTAAYLVDEQGVVSATTRDEVGEAQGSLLAAVTAVLRQALADLELGPPGAAIVEAERGAVVAGWLGDGRMAVAVARAGANLGMIRVELRRLRRAAQ